MVSRVIARHNTVIRSRRGSLVGAVFLPSGWLQDLKAVNLGWKAWSLLASILKQLSTSLESSGDSSLIGLMTPADM